MSSSGGSKPELSIGECKFQTPHPLYGTRHQDTLSRHWEVRITQDGQGKMECS